MKLQEHQIDSVEINPEQNATHCIIWLHGLGADGHDFVPIVPELKLPSNLAIRFIFPHAPIMPVTINNGYKMRAWFDIHDFSLSTKIDKEGIQASQKTVESLIETQIASGIPSENIILAGFSQGGAIALTTGINFNKRLGGILALSTYLPLPDQLLINAATVNRSLPIFVAHGTQDSVLPFLLGESTAKVLEQSGFQVDWHSYVMPHSVCGQEIADISKWIQTRWG